MSIHIFFYKQKTAYEMRISDWSSDVCSSDLVEAGLQGNGRGICRAAGHQDVGRNARARQVTSHDGCMRFQSGFRSAVTDHAGTQHVVEACRDVNDAAPLAPHHFRHVTCCDGERRYGIDLEELLPLFLDRKSVV